MTLNRNRRLVRWAYWGSDEFPPRQTTLCELFWRAVVLTPLVFSILAILAPVWWPILKWEERGKPHWDRWRKARAVRAGKPTPSREPSTIALCGAWVKAVKEKVCPIVYLSDEPDRRTR